MAIKMISTFNSVKYTKICLQGRVLYKNNSAGATTNNMSASLYLKLYLSVTRNVLRVVFETCYPTLRMYTIFV